MFLRQPSDLIALDKHRHFGRAAESCHVSQPALSNGIRELERELDVTIIKRNRTFERITPEGERVIQWVRQVLASLEGLKREADLVRSVPRGHLSIGVIPTTSHAATLLSAEYRDILPQLSLEVMSLSTPEILQRLKSQDLHLGMLYDRSLAEDEYEVLPLFAERYVLVASEQASLPHELNWAEVAGLPLCRLSRDMQNRQTPEEIFKGVGATPNVVLETNAIRVLLVECLNGRAFSVMPLSALPTYPDGDGLRIHPITPEHAEGVCLVRLRRESQPSLSEAAWRIAVAQDRRRGRLEHRRLRGTQLRRRRHAFRHDRGGPDRPRRAAPAQALRPPPPLHRSASPPGRGREGAGPDLPPERGITGEGRSIPQPSISSTKRCSPS